MKPLSTEQCETFVAACRQAAACDLVRYSSGNLSWRVDDNSMAVTAKGAWLGRMSAADIAVCRIEDGLHADGPAASVEAGFHAGIFRVRPDIHVILHCQSPCATAMACGRPEDFDFSIIPEIPFHVGEPAVVECHSPGSPGLASVVIDAAKTHDLILLRNHGQVVMGRGFDETIQRAGFFELACEILLFGRNIQPLPKDVIDALRCRATDEGTRSI